MSDDIVVLAGHFKTYTDLQLYSDQQFVALKKAAERILAQEKEIEHLKNLLASTTTLIPEQEVQTIIVTPEEAICSSQINLLQDRGMNRELTLEEIKKLDLLIKNKRLAKEQATAISGNVKKPKKDNVSEAQLIQIASIHEKEEG